MEGNVFSTACAIKGCLRRINSIVGSQNSLYTHLKYSGGRGKGGVADGFLWKRDFSNR